MSERLKYIVQELSKPPYSKPYNLISFDGLESIPLLQILNDVISEIDPKNKIDIREESSDQTALRLFDILRIFRYKTPTDAASLSAFRQGLVVGDKLVIHPIIEWLLQRSTELKKRAYLAKFLVKVAVPQEYLQEDEVFQLYQQYEATIESFKQSHQQLEALNSSGVSTADIKKDITAMQDEKEQLIRRVDRLRKKVESYPNSAPMLDISKKLRSERDREAKLQKQIQEQKLTIGTVEQRIRRSNQQVKDMRQAAVGATPEGLLQRLEEETKVNSYIVTDKLPKETEARRKYVQDLHQVVSKPAMSHADLEKLNQVIRSLNAELNKLIEQRMVSGDPREDKLSLFRQQASIIGRKKEAAAEALREAREETARAEAELQERRGALRTAMEGQGRDGMQEAVPKDDELQRYVAKLRSKSTVYKQKRAVLGELKAEHGVLARTDEMLKQRDETMKRTLNATEATHGVAGYWDTQENLEKISEQMSELNVRKGQTLEDMSTMIAQLNTRINEKKNQLAPIIKELRPLRQRTQEVQQAYDKKKSDYDTMVAGLESNRSKIDQEVRLLREECRTEEARHHYISAMRSILDVQQVRLQEEMKSYVAADTTADKRKSYRDLYNKKISEQEHLGKSLRERQKTVRESHAPSLRQVKMWQDLERLLDCKLRCREAAKVRQLAGGDYAGVTRMEQDRLVL